MNHRVTSKEQILEQAMAIALNEGIDKISIRKVAGVCNIAIGSIYNYFPNKEALTLAITEQFWAKVLENQDKIYRRGMGFTMFLEQYYHFLYGRLHKYDKSWIKEMDHQVANLDAICMLKSVLKKDRRVNDAIWNMELNEDAFCEYVLVNIMALLRAGESNCRFFIFLIEHFLYDV